MPLPENFRQTLLDADLVSPSFLWYCRELLDQCKDAPHGVWYVLEHDYRRFGCQCKLIKRTMSQAEIFDYWMNNSGLKHDNNYYSEFVLEKFLT